MPKRWDSYASLSVESPQRVEAFLEDIERVCRYHGLSISHEDTHGAFEIEPFSELDIKWLRDAAINNIKE